MTDQPPPAVQGATRRGALVAREMRWVELSYLYRCIGLRLSPRAMAKPCQRCVLHPNRQIVQSISADRLPHDHKAGGKRRIASSRTARDSVSADTARQHRQA
jgi:hypothetical protein